MKRLTVSLLALILLAGCASPAPEPAPEPEPQGTPHDQAPGAETDTYCRVCGQKNAPGAAICENCGAPRA